MMFGFHQQTFHSIQGNVRGQCTMTTMIEWYGKKFIWDAAHCVYYDTKTVDYNYALIINENL